MKRILFVSMGLGFPAGVANLGASVVAAFDEFAGAGYLERVDVSTYLDNSVPERLNPAGETRIACGSKSRFVANFARLLNSGRPELVLYDTIGGARMGRFPLPGVRRSEFGLLVHGLELDPDVRSHLLPILGRAKLIVANSPTTEARVANLVPERLNQLHVIYPPVSADRIAMWSDVPRTSLADREPVVLIAGRLETGQPGKGHETLLAAWPTVRERLPAAKLVIAGDGDKRPSLMALATDLAIQDAVEFVGFVSDTELGNLFRRSVAYAMPSCQEGFGIVYAEAMWHGLPCVGSTADAAGDVIEHGKTGFLVPYGDPVATAEALVALLGDRGLASRLGEAGRRRYEDLFTVDAFTARWADVLGLTPDGGRAARQGGL